MKSFWNNQICMFRSSLLTWAGQDAEHLEASYMDGENARWYSRAGKRPGGFLSSSAYTCHRTQEKWKLMFTQNHEPFSRNGQELAAIQTSFGGWMDTQSVVHTCDTINKIKGTNWCYIWWCGYISNVLCWVRETRCKGLHALYDSIHIISWGRQSYEAEIRSGCGGGVDYKGARGDILG